MTRAPISVCMISRDEPLLAAALASVRSYVEEIVVLSNGSDDTSESIARRYNARFGRVTACNDDQGRMADFALARAYSFDLASQPWAMWLDSDDLAINASLLPEMIAEITARQPDGPLAVFVPYEYAFDDAGRCNCLLKRERIVRMPRAFEWRNPVHEVIQPCGGARVPFLRSWERYPGFVIRHQAHKSTTSRETGRNLRILRAQLEREGMSDLRLLYYLGKECFDAELYAEAEQHLTAYVERSGWDDEKAMACMKLVSIRQSAGDLDGALRWAFQIVAARENWGEGYFMLARIFYQLALKGRGDERRNFERVVYFARHGLAQPIADTPLFINPLERSVSIHRYLNMALNALGDLRGALASCETALATAPDDQDLKRNRDAYAQALAGSPVSRDAARYDPLISKHLTADLGSGTQGSIPGKCAQSA